MSDERHNWIWGDDIEGADVFVIFWEMAYACNLLGNIIGGLVAVIEAEVAAYSAQEFINIQSKFVDGETVTEILGTIEFKDVKFAYPKAPMIDVLKGVSFVMEANRSYAIVGESGAGKSTIIQLIERFYEPTGGAVLIDNQPVSSYNIKDLRRQIGYVSQEPILFNLTIRENILMSKKDASETEIEEALKHANAYDFINNLEKKLDQNVGMKGSQLSGGQKQRVAIARAIITKPKILLLDEATSALDNLSEALVLKALKEIIRNFQMTTVSVAQKLSTIRHVDKIIVLENGFVSQEGSHSELMLREGKYQTMCRTQGIDFEKFIQTTDVGTAATIEILNTVALPREEISKESETPFNSLILRILKISIPYWPLLIIGLVAACGAGLSFPIFGAFIGKETYYLTGRTGDEMEDNIRKFAIFTLILSAFVFICFFLMFWCFAVLSAYISRDLRSKAFYQMLFYDAEFFDKEENNSSVLAQNLANDTEKVNSAGGPMIGIFLVIIIGLGGSCVIAFMWNYKLALVITASTPFQVFSLFRGYASLFTGLAHPELQQAKQMGLDAMINLKTVKAYGVEQELVTKHQSLYQTAYASSAPEAHASGFYLGLGVFFLFFWYATFYWYAAYLQKEDDIGYEDILISIFSNLMATIGIFTAAVYIPAVGQGIHAARRIFGIIDYVPKINAQEEGRKDAVEGPIEFKDVCFSYAGRDTTVLDHVNFNVLKNQKIGVTGPSGSGKTTIVQLILRFYDPTSGQIFINGIDITTFDLKHLRTYISTVGQEPVLFRGSLRHNVGFGYKDEEGQEASDGAILSAMEQAKVNFTGDLNYEIGARGQTISGGQKQRVSIARAIVRNPKILLFDEATSALDSQTERDIMATLEEVGKERTVILIAHRLSTIRQCDNILVMEGGRITEQGTHEELLGHDGQYASLWNSVNKQL